MSLPSLVCYTLPQAADFPANRVPWQPDAARAVLLIHDMQRYFLACYGEDSAIVHALTVRIGALRDWADRHGVPVVYTAQPAQQSAAERALLNDMWGPGLCGADPALQQLLPALAARDGDVVLDKWRYSAFQRSPLAAQMQQQGRDQLLICGVYAHIGCLMTAADAFMRDIQPFMVGDAVADFSVAEQQMALAYVAGRCGVVLSTAAVIGAPGRDWLRAQVLALLDGDEPVPGDDDDLIDYGLDSVQLMAMVSRWKLLGIDVSFEALARRPSLNAWWRLIAPQAEGGDAL